MSLFIEIFLIGVGLSMDAFAVSICKGLSMKEIKKRDVFIIPQLDNLKKQTNPMECLLSKYYQLFDE